MDFFFVLSGFIIYYAHGRDDRSAVALSRFLHRRFIRIYVPYLPITIGLVLAYHLFPGMSASNREWSLIKSLTLLPISGDVALSVAWTLVHEVLFYIVFAILFYGRILVFGLAAWSVSIIGYNALGLDYGALNIIFHALNLQFLLGIIAAYLLRKVELNGCPLMALGLVLAAPILAMASADPILRTVFGLGMALIILGAAMSEREGKLGAPAISGFLGGASYALYLLHVPALSVLVRAGSALNLGWFLTLATSIATCSILAFIYYGLFERPVLAHLTSGRARATTVPA